MSAVDALTLNLSVAYVDDKYTKFSCAGILTYNGSNCGATMPAGFAPSSAPATGCRGTVDFHHLGAIFVQAVGRCFPVLRSDFQCLTAPTATLPGQDSRNGLTDLTIRGLPVDKNLNVRAGARFGGFEVSLFSDNLTDVHPVLFTSATSPLPVIRNTSRAAFDRERLGLPRHTVTNVCGTIFRKIPRAVETANLRRSVATEAGAHEALTFVVGLRQPRFPVCPITVATCEARR